MKNTTIHDKWLFKACFIALIATSFAFVTRFAVLADWGRQFNLSSTQMGEIGGAGVWPFAISIILFSLIIDRIGYGTAMVFAFISHIIYGVMAVFWAPNTNPDQSYSILFAASVILALGNGAVEAVINPVVATMFDKDKTKWLNILHAGWPAGLVGAGLMTMAMGGADWRFKVGLIFIPAVIYGLMLINQKWPVQERVAAGVSYMDMLREFGLLASLLVIPIVMRQISVVFSLSVVVEIVLDIALIIAFAFAIWPKATSAQFHVKLKTIMGSPMLFILMLIMMPLATTEIGTDGWITALMENAMGDIGLPAVTVLVYTSAIMMTLRFFAGPIVHRLKPLGLLAVSSAVAAIGLFLLSTSTGIAILIVATLYGLGKTFFWPTMLGVVSEQCPRGGALTLNAVGGMGMLAVGVLGMPFIGSLQDNASSALLHEKTPALYEQVVVEKDGIFGQYEAIDNDKKAGLNDTDNVMIDKIIEKAQHGALAYMAIFPVMMLLSYVGLMVYFKTKGGYRPKLISVSRE
ncbi:MAG: MFS transporter [Candidatus Marinimicrobia bacterium]|nr:MFS transporter [Candidatus Neomarinimicrobiota bacterium]